MRLIFSERLAPTQASAHPHRDVGGASGRGSEGHHIPPTVVPRVPVFGEPWDATKGSGRSGP